MQWETNPAMFRQVMKYMAGTPTSMLAESGVRGNYRPWTPPRELFSADPAVAPRAMEQAVAELTKQCSKESHGAVGSRRDFEPEHQTQLELAIRCVYTAFRASITALRVEAVGRRVGDSGDVKLALTLKNLADRSAKLESVKVGYRGADGKLVSRPGWTVSLAGKSIDGGDHIQVRVKVEDVPREVKLDDLVVDVHGDVQDTPDAGWRRAKVAERALTIVRNPSATTALPGKKGPIDVVVVLDTTGSMQKSIDSMRANAIASIKKLKEKSDDIRLAVTTFRDLKIEADRPHFLVKPFTSNLQDGFAFLNGLRADSGGDTPEDQLHGISLALELWEKEGKTPDRIPTKIVIVVTDAPAHSPDSVGNTFESIAKRAAAVDPAHIYPIIVGNDPNALAHAERLAKDTNGKVLRAATGDEVADAVMAGVADAAETYAPAAAEPGARRWWLVWLGAGLALVAIGGLALSRRHAEVAHG